MGFTSLSEQPPRVKDWQNPAEGLGLESERQGSAVLVLILLQDVIGYLRRSGIER